MLDGAILPEVFPHVQGGVEEEELRKVPYITHIPKDGRSVFLQPFFDKKDKVWKQFVPQGTKLTWIFAEPVESSYYSEAIADPKKDVYLKVLDVIPRYFSYQSLMDIRFQIMTKIIFSAVVLDKYFLSVIRFRITKDVLVANLVVTDLEYFFANARSIYDLNQKLFSGLWERKTGIKMKTSFRQIAQKSRQDLQSQYKLPEAMIEYYMSSKDFFLKIRAIRDSIFHYPSEGTMQPQRFVSCDDDGFAVSKSNLFPDPLGVSFDIWPRDKAKPNGLVSVLGLISYVNKMVLGDSDKFSDR